MKTNKYTKLMLKDFIKFYEITVDCLSAQSKGHTDQWPKVQEIMDKIEDTYDIDSIKEDLNE